MIIYICIYIYMIIYINGEYMIPRGPVVYIYIYIYVHVTGI